MKHEQRAIRNGALSLFFLLLFFTSCTKASGNKPTMEYMADMSNSPSVKAQESPMRLPPDGTIPRGFDPYPYKPEEGDRAGVELQNTLSMNKAMLKKGQDTFNTYCMVCHGPTGQGNGSIVPKFPRPPSLHSDKVRTWSDGRIYHVITRGQNLMPSYASQVFPDERWAAIHYVRALQRAVNPTKEDVEVFERMLKGSK